MSNMIKCLLPTNVTRNTLHYKHLPEEERAILNWKKVAFFVCLFFHSHLLTELPIKMTKQSAPRYRGQNLKNDWKTS